MFVIVQVIVAPSVAGLVTTGKAPPVYVCGGLAPQAIVAVCPVGTAVSPTFTGVETG